MVGWHHQLNGHEFEQVPGDGEGQGSLACRSPWGHKESDMTEQLNNNKYTSSFPKPDFASEVPFRIKMLLPLTLKYCLALWCHGNDWRQRT